MSESPVPRLGRSARLYLFTELQTLTHAGIPIVTAVAQLAERDRGKSNGPVLDAFSTALRGGAPLADAARQAGVGDAFELALLRVGEKTGDLPPLFQHMVDRLERERDLARRLIAGLLYPSLLIHIAILLVPLHNLFGKDGSLGKYLLQSFVPLGILYGLVILGFLLRRPLGGLIDAVGMNLPVLGKIRRNAELARFFSAMDPLYASGIPLGEAVRRAADTCRSRPGRAAAFGMADQIDQGKPLAEAMKDASLFSRECQAMVETAERSGDMQPTFKVLFRQYEGNLKNSMRILAIVVPILVFLGVAGYIAWIVISFWVGYYSQVLDL